MNQKAAVAAAEAAGEVQPAAGLATEKVGGHREHGWQPRISSGGCRHPPREFPGLYLIPSMV